MLSNRSWPVLLLAYPDASELERSGYQSSVIQSLKSDFDCRCFTAGSFREAWEIFQNRADLGCVIISCGDGLDRSGSEDKRTKQPDSNRFGQELGKFVRKVSRQNDRIPIILLADHQKYAGGMKRVFCISDRPREAAQRISQQIQEYIRFVLPDFFENLVAYTEKNKYAWHTPGHMGGAGFLRAPAGTAFYKYYGENALRSDLSVSVSELGSLLDHSGVTGEAEKNSARVFGADQTYYVLNGTSSSNQIIWSSQVTENDAALLDRNCHKSLNYAMVRTKARPVYMVPRRSRYGMIGPVGLSEFTERSIAEKMENSVFFEEGNRTLPVSMMALTNSTYDGLCYNVRRILEVLSGRVQRVHFDEAWFAYAAFHPIYRDHYGLADIGGAQEPFLRRHGNDSEVRRPLIFCSQSTHKLLTALSQSSMLHIRNGSELAADPVAFNESYMMYASTSPQYSMIASLDVATKMMQDQGFQLNHRIICDAVEIRKKIAEIHRRTEEAAWSFRVWQPEWVTVCGQKVRFEDADTEYLASHQEPWVLSAEDDWHGFGDIEEDYVMLDPIKLTIMTPGIARDGSIEEEGIPALVVSRFFAEYHVVCEKADYYSFLMLNSIGTDPSKQDALLEAMESFRICYETNRPLSEILPELPERWPQNYGSMGLADHCRQMHRFFRETDMLQAMHRACGDLPKPVMTPSKAYENIVCGDVELVELKAAAGRTAAAMVVPYPPGIPILMGGECIEQDSHVLRYLLLLEQFENRFPGYESEIHGIKRMEQNGKTYFQILCIDEKEQENGV